MVRSQEREVARHWWALPAGTWLPLLTGGYCQVCFTGRAGGAAGPDVRDAVLRFSAREAVHHPWAEKDRTLARWPLSSNTTMTGAVEFHVHATDWFAHLHQRDPRYNDVILHVVLSCDIPVPTLRENGSEVPVCSLQDILVQQPDLFNADGRPRRMLWPCQRVLSSLSETERDRLLMHAGMSRLEEKAQLFVEQLHRTSSCGPFDHYDRCLLPALLESLAYGRDRALFRSLGERFVESDGEISLFDAALERLSPLDARRIYAFQRFYLRWGWQGCWHAVRALMTPAVSSTATVSREHDVVLARRKRLQSMLRNAGFGVARSDIVICNVLLPFALAIAFIEHDDELERWVERLYATYPGLSSNQVTRAMCAQLQLPRAPDGACQQQGLHAIYQRACREKRCDLCELSDVRGGHS